MSAWQCNDSVSKSLQSMNTPELLSSAIIVHVHYAIPCYHAAFLEQRRIGLRYMY